MKKALALLCAAALAASLAACGGETSTPEATPEPPVSSAPEATPEATPDVDPDQPATPPEGETDSTGGVPGAVEADVDLSALVDAIYAEYELPIMAMTVAVDLGDAAWAKQYTGLDDVSQIEAAVASEAAISSQAYSLVLVRVAEGADAAQVADQMAAGINPQKWICAMADDIMVGSAGNVAMLVMVDSALETSAQNIADAFVAAAGDGASAWVPDAIGAPAGIPAGDGAEVQPVG